MQSISYSTDKLVFFTKPITPLVQLVERRFPKPNVVGSSPTGRVF